MTTASPNNLPNSTTPLLYTAHFGMRRKPFGGADPRLMIGAAAERVFGQLLDGVRRPGGLVVLSGEAGTGKTLMLRRLMHQPMEGLEFVLCYSTQLSFEDLLGYICDRLGLDTAGSDQAQRLLALEEHLGRRARQGRAVVLLVDEAQHLDDGVLSDVLKLARDGNSPAPRLVLAGSPALEARLDDQPLATTAIRCRLEPLSEAQVVEYVQRQVRAAGGDPEDLFPPPVMARIAEYSNGIPRLINALSDHALVLAQFTGAQRVAENMIDEVADELMLSSTPARPPLGSDPSPASIMEPLPSPVAEEKPTLPGPEGIETSPKPAPPPNPVVQAAAPSAPPTPLPVPAVEAAAPSASAPDIAPPETAAPPSDVPLVAAQASPAPAVPTPDSSVEQTLPQPTALVVPAHADGTSQTGHTETLPSLAVDPDPTARLPVAYTAGGPPTRRVAVVQPQAMDQPRKSAGVWYLGAMLLVILGGGAWLWYRSQTEGFVVTQETPEALQTTPPALALDPVGEPLRRDASPPQIQVEQAQGRADQYIPLAIAVQGDPQDTFTIDIAGLPRGATLNAGRQYSRGVWTLTAGELENLALRPGGMHGGVLTLRITAIAIPPYRGQSASSETELTVNINPMGPSPAPAEVVPAPDTKPLVSEPAVEMESVVKSAAPLPGPASEAAEVSAELATARPSPSTLSATPPPSDATPSDAAATDSVAAVASPVQADSAAVVAVETSPVQADSAAVVAVETSPVQADSAAAVAVETSPVQAAPAAVETSPVQAAATPPEASLPEATSDSAPGPVNLSTAKVATPSVAAFMESGDRLMGLGDLASARLFYEAAAQVGIPAAALAVGRTYDPVVLGQRGLRGVYADPLKAAQWYRKAQEAGAREAESRLSALARWVDANQNLSPEQARDIQRLLP